MTDQSASLLISLPPELRNAIWHYILVQSPDNDIPIPSSPPRPRFCANILRTCKQINTEATPILYGENTFHAHPSLLATLPALLTTPKRVVPPVRHPKVLKLIRRFHLHVRLDVDPRFTRAQVEQSFTGVEELEIDVFQAMYGSSDFGILRLFEGVRGVGRAVVKGSVGDGKFAEWLAACMMRPLGDTGLVEEFQEEFIGGEQAWTTWQAGRR